MMSIKHRLDDYISGAPRSKEKKHLVQNVVQSMTSAKDLKNNKKKRPLAKTETAYDSCLADALIITNSDHATGSSSQGHTSSSGHGARRRLTTGAAEPSLANCGVSPNQLSMKTNASKPTDCRHIFADVRSKHDEDDDDFEERCKEALKHESRPYTSESETDSDDPNSGWGLRFKSGGRSSGAKGGRDSNSSCPAAGSGNPYETNRPSIRRNSLGYLVDDRKMVNTLNSLKKSNLKNIAEQDKMVQGLSAENGKTLHIYPKTLYFVSVTLGIFFIVVGCLKLSPIISADAYKEMVRQYKLYYKFSPGLKTPYYKIGSSSIRKTTGYTEFYSGLIFIFLPEQNFYCKICKTLSTAFLTLVMAFNTYLHYHIAKDNRVPVYSYAMPLVIILVGKLYLHYFAYTDWSGKKKVEPKKTTYKPGRLTAKINDTTLLDHPKEGFRDDHDSYLKKRETLKRKSKNQNTNRFASIRNRKASIENVTKKQLIN